MTRAPDSAESAALDAAEAIAAQIAGHPSANKDAGRDLIEWRMARNQNRAGLMVRREPGQKLPYGRTTPDLPPSVGFPKGRYEVGQTPNQYVLFDPLVVAGMCPCAVAVVILHEAHRLSQVHATPEPPPPGVEPPLSYWQSAAATFRNEASLHIKDLENIRAARALLACSDPQCMADLDALERQARGWLQAINADLPQVNAGAGTNIPPFQAPY